MNNDLKNNFPVSRSEDLLRDLKSLIEQGRNQAVAAINSAITVTYWHVGKRINEEVLHGERAEYGKQVVLSLAEELVALYGKSFEAKNLRRMMQFAEVFPKFEIVVPLARQLSWSHFIILISLQSSEARSFYTRQAIEGKWSKRELQRQIERKAFERTDRSTRTNRGTKIARRWGMKRLNHGRHRKHGKMIFMNREKREKRENLEGVQSGIVRELLELREMIG